MVIEGASDGIISLPGGIGEIERVTLNPGANIVLP